MKLTYILLLAAIALMAFTTACSQNADTMTQDTNADSAQAEVAQDQQVIEEGLNDAEQVQQDLDTQDLNEELDPNAFNW